MTLKSRLHAVACAAGELRVLLGNVRACEAGMRDRSCSVPDEQPWAACVGTLTADMQGMPCGERAATFG